MFFVRRKVKLEGRFFRHVFWIMGISIGLLLIYDLFDIDFRKGGVGPLFTVLHFIGSQ